MPGKHILLIIDDNEDFQNLYGLVAESAGFAVEHVFSGQEAMQRFEREPIPTLILLDTRLPGADGSEILRVARSKEKWAGVRIFMITADLRAAQRYRTLPPDVPHPDGVIEKGSDSMKKVRELFEEYR